MLSTAVALNLEGAPLSFQEDMAKDGVAGAVLNGMNLRHILSTGMGATPENCNGVPFNASHVYASGNIVGDMYANVAAEATGRTLATRLYNMTDDAGMREMLSFLIARDTMHQQQWLAVIEELGGHEAQLPVPNSFPRAQEDQRFNYAFFVHDRSGKAPPEGRWTQGRSLDGKGEFQVMVSEPMGGEPRLAPARPDGGAQAEQTSQSGMTGMVGAVEGAVERAV
jgi:Mn-containing catalase